MTYKVTIKYAKTLESGATKKVSEQYLVDAESVTECEAIAIKEFSTLTNDFSVSSIKKNNLYDLIIGKGDYFWAARLGFITIDEKTAQEKLSFVAILVQADTFDEAKRKLEDKMKDCIADWSLMALQLTKYIDFLAY